MSRENIKKFYELLEANEKLQIEVKSFQSKHEDQMTVIEEFISVAAREGLPFSLEEFLQHLYENASYVQENEDRR